MDIQKHICTCNNCSVSNNATFSVYGKNRGQRHRTNYVLENNKKRKVAKYIVDDCLLASFEREKKCDYLFAINDENVKKAYFIELKGSGVLKSIAQIQSSYNILKNNFDNNTILLGRIVTTKINFPNLNNSIQYANLYKTLNKNLLIKNISLKEQLN